MKTTKETTIEVAYVKKQNKPQQQSYTLLRVTIGVVQLLSHIQLFAAPWPAACQTSLSFTISRSLLRLMSVESVIPSNHLILCFCLLLLPSIFPSIRVFSNETVFFVSGGQSIGVSPSPPVLPMNIEAWFPLGLTGWISLQSKGLSRKNLQHHSSKASILRHSAFMVQLSHLYMTSGKTVALTVWTFFWQSDVSSL